MPELEQAGQPELVLHHAVFDAGLPGRLVKRIRGGGIGGRGFFAIDMLARGDGLLDRRRAASGRLRVEINGVRRIGERAGEIGGPTHPVAHGGKFSQLGFVASDQRERGLDGFVVVDRDAALLEEGQQRADVMLVRAHASRDAVQNDAGSVNFHK